MNNELFEFSLPNSGASRESGVRSARVRVFGLRFGPQL